MEKELFITVIVAQNPDDFKIEVSMMKGYAVSLEEAKGKHYEHFEQEFFGHYIIHSFIGMDCRPYIQ